MSVYGVWHRARTRDPWRLAGTAPTEAEARTLMFDLMDGKGGGWTVRPVDRPPERAGHLATPRRDDPNKR